MKTKPAIADSFWLRVLRFGLVGVLVLGVFSFFVGQVFYVPSPSMVPTIRVGDVVLATKYSYGLRPYSMLGSVSLGSDWAIWPGTPRRGDIVVVKGTGAPGTPSGGTVIKRVIGLPGDAIRLVEGRLFVQTEPVTLDIVGPVEDSSDNFLDRRRSFYFQETLPDVDGNQGPTRPVSYVIADAGANPNDNFGPFTVPKGHMFLMGDNRDNSSDSRTVALGTVSMENLLGRAQMVLLSLKTNAGSANDRQVEAVSGWPFRADRWFRKID